MLSIHVVEKQSTAPVPVKFKNARRMALFVALLVDASENASEGWVSYDWAARLLGIDRVRDPGNAFYRLVQQLERRFPTAVEAESRTAGRWRLAPAMRGKIQVWLNGASVNGAALSQYLKSNDTNPAGVAAEEFFLPIDTLKALVPGDLAFARGDLIQADTLYAPLSLSKHALSAAAGTAKSLQVQVRREDFDQLLVLSKRLNAQARRFGSTTLAEYLHGRVEITLAWHSYQKGNEYELAEERLMSVRSLCERHSALWIDWLNLYGLISRRRAEKLASSNSGRQAEYRSFVAASMAALKSNLALSAVYGTPYQLLRALSNLANIIGVFTNEGQAGLIDAEFTPEYALTLMGLSEQICIRHGIGKDDIYNPIFIMSIARKSGITATDKHVWIAAGLPDAANGLTSFGKAVMKDVEGRERDIGPLQKAHLAFEICWCAVNENLAEDFDRHIAYLTDAGTDAHVSGFPLDRRLTELKAHIRKVRGQSGRWLSLLREF